MQHRAGSAELYEPLTTGIRRRYCRSVKASWEAFEAALQPVLSDLDRVYPGVFRVERQDDGSDLQAILWERDGSGSGVFMGDGWGSEVDAVVEIADKVQEFAIEAVWTLTGRGCWPPCPEHPDGRPLVPGVHDGRASWSCPVDDRVVAGIGDLDGP